jgi:hypothetical protein
LLESSDEKRASRRSSFSTASGDSEFSHWSDTGDLVDQLADEEDPLRIRLRESLEENLGGPTKQRSRRQKRVRYRSSEDAREKSRQAGALRKEDIPIPDPGPRKLSTGDKILAFIMAPNDGPSRIHGLHGKKLM